VNLEVLGVLEVLEVPGPQLRWFTGNCLIAKRCCHKNLEANRCFRAELLRGIDLVMMLHASRGRCGAILVKSVSSCYCLPFNIMLCQRRSLGPVAGEISG